MLQHPVVPLVIVEGFLGGGHRIIWGDFERHLQKGCSSPRPVFFAKVGAVSSLHDRACELYYDLVGGTVDYGEEHSRQHRHKRYGRTIFKGLYPYWSQEYPLHFVGHSMGGATITKLQHLIKHGHFGSLADPDMFLSVTSISTPFRGTQVVYSLGERVDAAPLVRPFSVGDLLSKFVHVGAYLNPLLPDFLDIWRLEARSLAFHETSVLNFLQQLCHSDFARSRDVAPWDVTFAAAEERDNNMEGEPNAGTFYKSFAAVMTQRTDSNNHTPTFKHIFSMPLFILASLAGRFDFSSLQPVPSFLKKRLRGRVHANPIGEGSSYTLGEEFFANDGVAPLFSQWHPLECNSEILEPGIWHVYELPDTTHTSLVPFWWSTERQQTFWKNHGCWLDEIDILHCIEV
ncbi:alpha/beta-hydrolase [Mucidula mucida]|nr:alpha/beta-hydrolase [Mucidula mucida]